MPRGRFDDEEPVTGTVCLACGGEAARVVETRTGYRTETCPHCTRGTMSPKQELVWRARKSRP
jgi:hypothetical protein